jgi:putative RNA 2'-phosphotransferase
VERERAVRISKLLSFGLRHNPRALGFELDAAGWASVDVLLGALAASGEVLSREELEEVVRTSDKQRFALSADGARIRANQGHSVDVDLELPPRDPPEWLYHGTVDRFLVGIRNAGLLRGARNFVHLSADEPTARVVAKRRKGSPVILTVRAAEMRANGHVFHISANGVWLTEHVPPAYIVYPPA